MHAFSPVSKARINKFYIFRQCMYLFVVYTRLVIGTSRTVGSAKKFVRITSGFGGGEFTKMLRKVCTCQKLKLSFFTAPILQNQRMLCCGECFHD